MQKHSETHKHIQCSNCINHIPQTNYYYKHQKLCAQSRSSDSCTSSQQSQSILQFYSIQRHRSNNINHKNRHKDRLRQCKYCKQKYSYGYINQHESFYHKNQMANQLRKQFSESANSSNQYSRHSHSSEEDERINRQRDTSGRQREPYFHHRPRRNYTMQGIYQNQTPSIIIREPSSSTSQNIQSQLQQALQRLSLSLNQLQRSVQTGMTKSQLSSFQKWKYEQYNQMNDKCFICLQEYTQTDFLITLKCFHSFHQPCVVQWLQQNPSCPLCKTKQNQN